jgi:hypothetical protein
MSNSFTLSLTLFQRLSNNVKERVKEFDIKVFEKKICEVVENI